MKKFAILAALLQLAGASAHAAYDSSWYVTEYWSGEWPNGFSVVKPGTVIDARPVVDAKLPNLDDAKSVRCELPYLAVFSPWNEVRNQASDAHYFTASQIVPFTAKEDFLFPTENGDLPIKKGQTIEYLIYGAEGSFSVRINGQEFEADQTLFDHVLEPADRSYVSDEWLRLNCENGGSAWINYRDVSTDDGYVDGIGDRGPGTEGYGQVRDITEAEAETLRSLDSQKL